MFDLLFIGQLREPEKKPVHATGFGSRDRRGAKPSGFTSARSVKEKEQLAWCTLTSRITMLRKRQGIAR